MPSITLTSQGKDIASTDFWESETEAQGFPFCSFHQGCFRLLLPRNRGSDVPRLKLSRMVTVARGPWPEKGSKDVFSFKFEGGAPLPISLHLDGRTSFDRLPAPAAENQPCQVALWVWSPTGPVKAHELTGKLIKVTRLGSTPPPAVDKPVRLSLSQGIKVSLERSPQPDALQASRQGSEFHLVASERILRLKANGRDGKNLSLAASLAGAALHQEPFLFLLLLAFCQVHEELPDPVQLDALKGMARGVDVGEAEGPVLSEKEIQALARHHLRAVVADEIPPPLPDGNWNAARMVLFLAERLWHLPPETGKLVGTFPLDHGLEEIKRLEHQQRMIMVLGGLGLTASNRARLPLPVKPNAHPAMIFSEWICLMWGEGSPPSALRPHGLGDSAHYLKNFLNLTPAQKTPLLDVATNLLARAERPVPHYLKRVFDVRIPDQLVPQCAEINVDGLRFQVESAGLWVGLLDPDKNVLAATYWAAQEESFWRMPISFNPDTWLLTHALCAALWLDLCREAIRTEVNSQVAASGTQPTPKPTRPVSSPLSLPIRNSGRHPEPATWCSPAEIQTISISVREHGRLYRRLPAGWQNRKENRDYQIRRDRAIERAISYGCVPPPPSYTFVRPYSRQNPDLAGQDIRVVKSQGLFALTLACLNQQNDPELDKE